MPRFDIFQLTKHYYQTSQDGWLWLLFILIGLDVATGLIKSWVLHRLNSSISLEGWGKHSGVAIVGIIVYPILTFLGFEEVAMGIIAVAVITYCISVLENLVELKVPMPKVLKSRLEKIKEQFDSDER